MSLKNPTFATLAILSEVHDKDLNLTKLFFQFEVHTQFSINKMNIKRILTTAAAIGLSGIFLLTTEKKRRYKYNTKHLSFQGHRGARGLLPENTIPSFIKCLELGVPAFELDVVVSRDKEVVVSHEGWFSHEITTKPNGEPLTAAEEFNHLIYQMDYDQIKQYDCGKRGHPRFPYQRKIEAYKPLLKDVITACDTYTEQHALPPVLYNIEIKSYKDENDQYGLVNPEPFHYCEIVFDTIQKAGIEKRCIIQSFDVAIVQAMKAIAPHLSLSLLVDNEDGLETNLERLGFIPAVYAPHYKLVTRKLVQKVHHKGMKLITWTVNDTKTMRKLVSLGIDGLITDYPNLKMDIMA